jgi:hypothetical protein
MSYLPSKGPNFTPIGRDKIIYLCIYTSRIILSDKSGNKIFFRQGYQDTKPQNEKENFL